MIRHVQDQAKKVKSAGQTQGGVRPGTAHLQHSSGRDQERELRLHRSSRMKRGSLHWCFFPVFLKEVHCQASLPQQTSPIRRLPWAQGDNSSQKSALGPDLPSKDVRGGIIFPTPLSNSTLQFLLNSEIQGELTSVVTAKYFQQAHQELREARSSKWVWFWEHLQKRGLLFKLVMSRGKIW